MKPRRLFDELRDMQEETNSFFNEVYDRLSRLSDALEGWREREGYIHGRTDVHGGFEQLERRSMTPIGGAVITERYERRVYISSDASGYENLQPFREISRSPIQALPASERQALPGAAPRRYQFSVLTQMRRWRVSRLLTSSRAKLKSQKTATA
jgi:hypothetical protein